jgi:hypothetical protein
LDALLYDLPEVRALSPWPAEGGAPCLPKLIDPPPPPPPPALTMQVFGLRSAPPLPSDGSRWELSSPIVSREHCALEYDARSGRWSVTDSGSTFGTAVGGCKLSGGEAVPLRPGSELLLGSSLADSRALGFVLEPDDC